MVEKGFSSPLLSPWPTEMSNPVPPRAIVGGTGTAPTNYDLLLLTCSVFRISGLIHRCWPGAVEPTFSIGGHILGSVAIGALQSTISTVNSLPVVAVTRLLAGIGAKVGRTSRQISPV